MLRGKKTSVDGYVVRLFKVNIITNDIKISINAGQKQMYPK